LTTSRFKAADTNFYGPLDLPWNKVVGGVTGSRYRSHGGYDSIVFNRTSGTSATPGMDGYDTIDDAATPFPTANPFPDGPANGLGANWVRDSVTDIGGGSGGVASDGVCNGTESCIYIDNLSGMMWAKPSTSNQNWETAITACSNLSLGSFGPGSWRVPTQKEFMMAYINGIAVLKSKLALAAPFNYWTATTKSDMTANAYYMTIDYGTLTQVPKTNAQGVMCVR
jgi:hypothetical protein